MITLDAISKSFGVVLGALKTTNDCPWIVSYFDTNSTATTAITANDGITNGLTGVTVVSAPPSSPIPTVRQVKSFMLTNADTVTTDVEIQYVDGVNTRTISFTLATGYTLGYEDDRGWYVVDLYGATVVTTGPAITGLTGDATATGPGVVPITLATVNSDVGTFGDATLVPVITVNAKGLVTAVTTAAINNESIFTYQEASGVGSVSFGGAGTQTINLNTGIDPNSNFNMVSGNLTVNTSGTYDISAYVSGYQIGPFKASLYIGGTGFTVWGSNATSATTDATTGLSVISAQIALSPGSGTLLFQIHNSSASSNGFGPAVGIGVGTPEIYAQIKFTRVAD
jgi:hypothetical protein